MPFEACLPTWIAQPLTMPSTRERPASEELHQARTSEESLVNAAQGGDEAAFGALIRRHQDRVFRLVGRFYRRPEDVEDAAQETFLRAWRKIGSYRRDAPFEHWLTRLCLNLCYQRLRRKRLDTGDLEEAPEPMVTESDPTAATDARRLLARLAPHDRFVLLLLDGEGWSVAEIAERLGWSRVNVRVRAHRARKKLCRLVEDDLKAGAVGAGETRGRTRS